MADSKDRLKAEMISRIDSGGAWFSTRPGSNLKIGAAGPGGSLYARECVIGQDGSMHGAAYTFARDWFDISFHGRLVDIYIDPDTMKSWDVTYDEARGAYFTSEGDRLTDTGLAEFCRQADKEAASGRISPYHIDGAPFAKNLEPSELRMGRGRSILSLVDIVEKDGKKIAVTKDQNK